MNPSDNSRRRFIANAGAASGALLVGGCGQGEQAADHQQQTGISVKQQNFKWKMATTWPRDLPGAGTGAQRLADNIRAMSNGRLDITLYSAGELVPAFEIFDSAASGIVEMGHGAAYYWKGKVPASQYYASVPFGMTALESNSWLYYGGGIELWHEIYQPFGLIAFPGGNTGVQMGGWYNLEINSVADLQGLKIRMPGLGGEVMRRAGATVQNIPGAEIFTALSTGTIDATEWIGPWNDLAFGLYQAAQYYYYPGWQEPGSTLECLINQQAFESLPEDLQEIVRIACQSINMDMHCEYTARNQQALDTLVNQHGVELRQFPDEVLARLKTLSQEVIQEIADGDEMSQKVHASYFSFMEQVRKWTAKSEEVFLQHR